MKLKQKQLEYAHTVNLLYSKGSHFKDHLYALEIHPITGVEFCEREDEGHIFKVRKYKGVYSQCFCSGLAVVSGRVDQVTFS